VANALFAATGARVRSLPMTPEKIAAVKKGVSG
jgi:CO/xanthine dehydrogenase Mo-binding subunit